VLPFGYERAKIGRPAPHPSQVDTGWVTDNAPGGRGAVARAHKTHVAPPLDDNDGASHVPRAEEATA